MIVLLLTFYWPVSEEFGRVWGLSVEGHDWIGLAFFLHFICTGKRWSLTACSHLKLLVHFMSKITLQKHDSNTKWYRTGRMSDLRSDCHWLTLHWTLTWLTKTNLLWHPARTYCNSMTVDKDLFIFLHKHNWIMLPQGRNINLAFLHLTIYLLKHNTKNTLETWSLSDYPKKNLSIMFF